MLPSEKSTNDLFVGVPGPSPWYPRSAKLPIQGYQWVDPWTSGVSAKTYLEHNGKILLVMGYSHYVLQLSDTLLLIWNQRSDYSPVDMIVLDITTLLPLEGTIDDICQIMSHNKMGMIFRGQPIAEVSINVLVVEEDISFIFPKPISGIKELLILCHSGGISDSQNLALLVAHPQINSYKIYAQDWFNTGNFDFAYQWVTRVTRNPKTGEVHGEGIRLPPFILDDSLKKLTPETQF